MGSQWARPQRLSAVAQAKVAPAAPPAQVAPRPAQAGAHKRTRPAPDPAAPTAHQQQRWPRWPRPRVHQLQQQHDGGAGGCAGWWCFYHTK